MIILNHKIRLIKKLMILRQKKIKDIEKNDYSLMKLLSNLNSLHIIFLPIYS